MSGDPYNDNDFDESSLLDGSDESFEQRTKAIWLWLGTKIVFVLIAFTIAMTGALTLTQALLAVPDITMLDDYHPSETTLIYDRYNNLIANIHGDEDRVVVPLTAVSPYLKRAVLATEDNRFYEHNGIDIRGTMRATFVTFFIQGGRVQGGSSITQQLVKNIFLTPEQSLRRKIAEALLAIKIEGRYSKDKILELYLNQVYFGNLSYGAEKAARRYFHCSAKELTLAQSALLAGLLQSPEGLSPYSNPKGARRRQIEVLGNMVDYGYITKQQRDEAVKEKLVLNSRKPKNSKYPYFVTYVIQELEAKYGKEVVRRGGLKVYTTMDPTSQLKAQDLVDNFIKRRKWSGAKQGAFVALDVDTGEILALVGGTDFEHNQYNAATQSRRAVGSTFKPFVYLTGFRLEKITPKTPICDHPIRYGSWAPQNWDNKYMGCMDIRKALTLSRNTTTVQVGMKVGVDPVLETVKRAGITSPIDPNPSSFLGSSGTSPLELVNAYATFARGGIYRPSKSILKVEDNQGRSIQLPESRPKRVFDQDHVAALVDILIDVVAKGTGQNAILPNRVVAGKTGTTDQIRDIWFMGFTSDMVAGAWFGNPRNTPLGGVFSSDAAQIWHDFAVEFYKQHPREDRPFFIASNEYAAKAHLVHLMDAKGVAEARRTMKNLGLAGEESFSATSSVPATTAGDTARISLPEETVPAQGFSVRVNGQPITPGGDAPEVRPEPVPQTQPVPQQTAPTPVPTPAPAE